MPSDNNGRSNQRNRTRKDLLQAASRLMKEGGQVTLEAVAENAMVSRATAYRYFPNLEALLLEASLDVTAPTPEHIFAGSSNDDPVARMQLVDAAFEKMIDDNEAALRAMLAQSLQRRNDDSEMPARQNRRTPLIEAALEPAKPEFTPAKIKTLTKALAFLIGTEAMLVGKDVLQLDAAEARKVRRWAIGALIEAAKK